MKVHFKKLKDDATIPRYAHEGDAAVDLVALEQRTLEQGEPHMFKLGFASEFEHGYVALIQDRSSMGKRGVRVLGGVIDAGYRGEWAVVLINLTKHEIIIRPGERIAQALFMPVEQAKIEEVSEIGASTRGAGGFGSTGK